LNIKGWDIHYFTLFAAILSQLEKDVLSLSQKDPENYKHHPKTKLLAYVYNSIKEDVPSDPAHKKFFLGKTLGKQYGDWRRVKRGLPPRYRLFFRFESIKKLIVYVWMNDEHTYRKDGDKNDVYAVFARLLNSGKVPNDISELKQN
jgi:toxin YhaV